MSIICDCLDTDSCTAGQEMTGTEFEKAAGREKAKKWKASVRVAPTNGNQGEMVGDWLQVHPLRPKHVLQLCTRFCTWFLCMYWVELQ